LKSECFCSVVITKNIFQENFGESAVINFRSPEVNFLPNTCSVAFLTSEKFSGAEILKACTRLEASVGAACHSQDKPSGTYFFEKKMTTLSNYFQLLSSCQSKKNHPEVYL